MRFGERLLVSQGDSMLGKYLSEEGYLEKGALDNNFV